MSQVEAPKPLKNWGFGDPGHQAWWPKMAGAVIEADDHHIKPKQQGGEDRKENRMLVHQLCHHAHHQRHGYKAAGA